MLVVGGYHLFEEIGRGAMGRVYAARDCRSGEPVAIKALHGTRSSEGLYSIKQEFRVAQRLCSRHLVPIYELFIEQGTVYIAMPLLQGRTFDAWCASTGWREVPECLRRVVEQAVDGLADLHRIGLVHRDIKPHNILVDAHGDVVLLDYGLAEPHRPLQAGTRKASWALSGTLDYVAPEALWGAPPSPAQDMFALGATVFEGITRTAVPRDPLSWAVQVPALRLALQTACPELPADLRGRIEQLLSPCPEGRLSSPAPRLLHRAVEPTPARLDGRRASPTSAPRHDPALVWPPRRLGDNVEPPFVGRDHERADALARLEPPGARVAIEGPSGIGKTTLAEHVLVALEDTWVLAGRCHPGERIPFRSLDAVFDALSRGLEAFGPPLRKEMTADALAVLDVSFPLLRQAIAPDEALPPPPTDPEERRARLSVALSTLLRSAHGRRPILMWIDDVQWGDDDGLQLLREVLDRLGPHGPRLLLSGRCIPHALSGWLPTPIALTPLSYADAKRVAVSHARVAEPSGALPSGPLPSGPADDELDGFVHATQGIPALIAVLARARGTGARPCFSFAELITHRMSELEPSAGRMLLYLALAERPLPLNTVHALAATDQPRRVLAALESTRLVRRTTVQRTECLELIHDCLGESVRALPIPERPELHRCLAQTLECTATVAPEVVAVHWERAGDDARARVLWLGAGAVAERTLAFEHAATCFRRALQTSAQHQRLEPLGHLARALALAGRAIEAAQAYEQAAALAETPLGHLEQAATHYLLAGDIDAGLTLTRRCFAAHGVSLPAHPAHVLMHLVARRLRGAAIPSNTPPRPQIIARDASIADLAYATATCLGRVDPSIAALIQQIHLTHGLRSQCPLRAARALALEAVFRSLSSAAGSYAQGGEVDELVRRATEVLGTRVDPRLRAMLVLVEAVRTWAIGHWDACLAASRTAERIAEHECMGAWWELGLSRSLLQDALRWSGRYPDLRASIDHYLGDAGHRGDRFAAVTFRVRFASTLALIDDRPGTAADHNEAGAEWRARGVHLQHLVTVHARAEHLLYIGASECALAYVERQVRAMRFAPLLQSVPPRAKLHHLRASCRLAVAAEFPERRTALLRALREDVRTLRAPGWGYTDLLADLVDLAADHLRGRDIRPIAAALRPRAVSLAMPQYAAALAYLDRDTEVEAETTLKMMGVAAPRRWAQVLIPGLLAAQRK